MPLGWQPLNIHHVIKSIGILIYCKSMISGGNQSPTSFLLFNQTQFLSLLFYIVNLILSVIYQSLWDRSCTYTLYYIFDLVHLQVKL
jgi:hypothetical protein